MPSGTQPTVVMVRAANHASRVSHGMLSPAGWRRARRIAALCGQCQCLLSIHPPIDVPAASLHPGAWLGAQAGPGLPKPGPGLRSMQHSFPAARRLPLPGARFLGSPSRQLSATVLAGGPSLPQCCGPARGQLLAWHPRRSWPPGHWREARLQDGEQFGASAANMGGTHTVLPATLPLCDSLAVTLPLATASASVRGHWTATTRLTQCQCHWQFGHCAGQCQCHCGTTGKGPWSKGVS